VYYFEIYGEILEIKLR